MPPPGNLDPTFGGDGKVLTDFTKGRDGARDVAIQANGKIVVVGRASTRRGFGRFALARYRANGHLDPAFGGDGVVTTNFAKREDAASAVAIQADGKIVAVGFADVTARVEVFAVARYDRDGTLDTTFGDKGKVTTGFTPAGMTPPATWRSRPTARSWSSEPRGPRVSSRSLASTPTARSIPRSTATAR